MKRNSITSSRSLSPKQDWLKGRLCFRLAWLIAVPTTLATALSIIALAGLDALRVLTHGAIPTCIAAGVTLGVAGFIALIVAGKAYLNKAFFMRSPSFKHAAHNIH